MKLLHMPLRKSNAATVHEDASVACWPNSYIGTGLRRSLWTLLLTTLIERDRRTEKPCSQLLGHEMFLQQGLRSRKDACSRRAALRDCSIRVIGFWSTIELSNSNGRLNSLETIYVCIFLNFDCSLSKSFSHKCIRWGGGEVSMYCLVCTPSVKMALVQCCRDKSYLSVSGPLLFFSGRDCNKMMGRAAAGGLPRTRQINGINYMELLREAHQIPNQQPLSHRCEHRHPARRSEDKEDKVNGDRPRQYKPMSKAWRILWAALRSHFYKARKTTRRSTPEVTDAFSLFSNSLS